VSSGLFWRSLGVQAVSVAVISAVLAALLPKEFFEDWGFLAGPLAWIACSLITARVLSLPIPFVLFAALAGGVAGTIVLIVAGHWIGVVAGLLVFAASCGSYEPGGGVETERSAPPGTSEPPASGA
jgi:hypothetical protein